MAQITITIPDFLETQLKIVAENQDRPFSQFASICLEQGFYQQLEILNKAKKEYLSLVAKKRLQDPPPEK